MNRWACSVGTIENSPAIYRREIGPDNDESRKGRLMLAGHGSQPFLRNLYHLARIPGDKSPGYSHIIPPGLPND